MPIGAGNAYSASGKAKPQKKDCYQCKHANRVVQKAKQEAQMAKETVRKLDIELTKKIICEHKEALPKHGGKTFEIDTFISKKITMLRRSFNDVLEHAIEDENIREWLKNFNNKSLNGWEYKGWGKNRPYPTNHPKYNPDNPEKGKHDNDTYWFYYYSKKIGGKTYWANVKNHKDLGEVLYTIEAERPTDIIAEIKENKK